jgi:hypothetical protein
MRSDMSPGSLTPKSSLNHCVILLREREIYMERERQRNTDIHMHADRGRKRDAETYRERGREGGRGREKKREGEGGKEGRRGRRTYIHKHRDKDTKKAQTISKI